MLATHYLAGVLQPASRQRSYSQAEHYHDDLFFRRSYSAGILSSCSRAIPDTGEIINSGYYQRSYSDKVFQVMSQLDY